MLCRFSKAVCPLVFAVLTLILTGGCSVEASKRTEAESAVSKPATTQTLNISKGATIKIAPNSPADTVRVFYRELRDGKIRDAIFLTNLRPAIEGLTDAELKEFQVDFEAIGKNVPPEIEINGEVISGDSATVTAKLPNEDLDKSEFQQIKLRKYGEVWVILTVDESAEKRIKQEGKNYFFNLRMETHEDEARDMLDRIAKAQMAFAAQNQGTYGEMAALIAAGFLPDDIRTSETTGYNYSLTVNPDKKSYSAAATPAVYGKSGRRSFNVELDGLGQPRLISRDAGPAKAK